MTAPDHAEMAEDLLQQVDEVPDPHGDGKHAIDSTVARAQVHATLAVAAALAGIREEIKMYPSPRGGI